MIMGHNYGTAAGHVAAVGIQGNDERPGFWKSPNWQGVVGVLSGAGLIVAILALTEHWL